MTKNAADGVYGHPPGPLLALACDACDAERMLRMRVSEGGMWMRMRVKEGGCGERGCWMSDGW
eukprot:2872292-Rhodomonas_salina.1